MATTLTLTGAMRKGAKVLCRRLGAFYLTAVAPMRYLVLLAPFLAAFIALTMRTRTQALVVLFTYLSVEGLLKLLAGYHPVVHVGMDIALLSVVGIWVAGAFAARQTSLPRLPFTILLILHVVWVMLLAFSPYTASLFVGVASWKVHITMIPLYVVGYIAAADEDAPRVFMRGLTVVWCLAFVVTIIQYTGGPGGLLDLGDVYMQRLSGYHDWRPFGTTALPGGEAVYAFIALPFAVALVLRGDYRLRDPWILFAILGSFVVFFISSGRQMFLGSLIVVLTMVVLQASRGRGRAAVVFLALLIALAGSWIIVIEYVQPAADRAIAQADVPEIWRRRNAVERFEELLDPHVYRTARVGGIHLITDRIMAYPFGAGLGRTGSAAAAFEEELTESPTGSMIQRRFGFADNFYAAMLVETGLPGTLMLTAVLFGLLALAVRLARRAPSDADSAFGALVAGYMVAMVVTSWGSQPLLANPTQAFFWVLGGMMARRYHHLLHEAAEENAPVAVAPVPAPV